MPCPTPIKVAAILLLVSVTAPAAGAFAFLALAAVTGIATVLSATLGVAALLAIPSMIGLHAGWRLLTGRLRQLNLLRWWVEYTSLACGVLAVPGAVTSAIEVWRNPSPTVESVIISGTACYIAVCSVAGMLAAVVLSAHVEDYEQWREAHFPGDEDPAFEFVDE